MDDKPAGSHNVSCSLHRSYSGWSALNHTKNLKIYSQWFCACQSKRYSQRQRVSTKTLAQIMEGTNSNSNVKYENLDPEAQRNKPTDYYDMSGTKYLVIFNHYKYKDSTYYRNKVLLPRNGTDADVMRLTEVFGNQLGFEVTVHHDKDASEIFKIVNELHSQDHSGTSCLCIVFLTHGSTVGTLYAADRLYYLWDVVHNFEDHPSLTNKPILFFVQDCSGYSELDSLGGKEEYILTTPVTQPDFFLLRSTVEEYLSFRDSRGSWLIQELCNVVEEHHTNVDLLGMSTMVHQRVAYNYTSQTKDPASDKKKQVSQINSTLTKLLKFNYNGTSS